MNPRLLTEEGKRPTPSEAHQAVDDLRSEPVPKFFNEDQGESWNYYLAKAPGGLCSPLDRGALTCYVVAECLHRQATIDVGKLELLTKSPVKGEAMQDPYLGIINKQAQIMLCWAAELGFSPASRGRVSTGGGVASAENPFAQY